MADSELSRALQRYRRKAMTSAYCHFSASDRLRRLELSLGVPVVIITVVLGSVLVANLRTALPEFVKWFGAILALIAAVLASVQTFFNPRTRHTTHKQIANRYVSLERRLELLLAGHSDGDVSVDQLSREAQSFVKEYDEINALTAECPTSRADYRQARQRIAAWIRGQQGYPLPELDAGASNLKPNDALEPTAPDGERPGSARTNAGAKSDSAG